MVIVDTTVWIDYLSGCLTPQTEWLDREVEHQRLALTDLNLCEVLQGIREEQKFTRVKQRLLDFEIFSTGGVGLAIIAAQNYRRLRSKSYTIRKTIDYLIASYCLENGHALLHNDSDFELFEKELGLQVVHP